IIYTSGSTGRPKGVCVQHDGAVNCAYGAASARNFEHRSTVLSCCALGFDGSLFEWLPAFASGACLVLGGAGLPDPKLIQDLIGTHGISNIFVTPALLAEFSEQDYGVKTTGVGGDKCSPELLNRFGDQTRFVNCYGPSEGTIFATSGAMSKGREITIGSPAPNTQIYIADARMHPVPVGVAGELLIGGIQVSRGYLGRAGLTAEKFIADPFSPEPGGRLYRTGDLARWQPDGNVEFLGRIDSQIKIRGMRVELGEIEAALTRQDCIAHAAVKLLKGAGTTSADNRIVAYVVPKTVTDEMISRSLDLPLGQISDADRADSHQLARELCPEVSLLRYALGRVLPDHMVPTGYVWLSRLPINTSGKVDLAALPAPAFSDLEVHEYAEPCGEAETCLAAIWADILDTPQVGRNDNFFEMGGNSLLAVRAASRLREAGWHCEVGAFFSAHSLMDLAQTMEPTVRQSTASLGTIPAMCDRIEPGMLELAVLDQSEIDRITSQVPGGARNIQNIYPLSHMQEDILLHHLSGGETSGDAYLVPNLMAFDTRDTMEQFLGALQTVIDRHDILRTSFYWKGLSEPVQIVWREAEVQIDEVLVQEQGRDAADALWSQIDPRRYRLSLETAPVMRGYATWDAQNGRWLLLLLMHHLISDHETMNLLSNEVRLLVRGRENELHEPVGFGAFIKETLATDLAAHEAYFTGLLGTFCEPAIPFGLSDTNNDGTNIVEATVPLPGTMCERIHAATSGLTIMPASLFHLAWALVLSKLTDKEDVVFGTVLLGRMRGSAVTSQDPGLFLNTLPVRFASAGEHVSEALISVHEQLSELVLHEHTPLTLASRCSSVPPRTPLFTTLLNYRHSQRPNDTEKAKSRAGIEYLAGEDRSSYPVALMVDDFGGRFSISAHVLDQLDPKRLCNQMVEAISGILSALEAGRNTACREIGIVDREERNILQTWCRENRFVDTRPLVHRMFEARAAEAPGAVALTYGGRAMTYGALNSCANRLAGYLADMGVGPEQRVVVCLQPGFEMVIAFLAILKAAGVYVPLDPLTPKDRFATIESGCAPLLILSDGTVDRKRQTTDIEVLDITRDQHLWADYPASDNTGEKLGGHSLAYVMHTSGSTGRPKGVGVEHQGLANLVEKQIELFALRPESRILQFSSIGFDASISEILTSLCSGATLCLAPVLDKVPGAPLAHFMATNTISHATLPPFAILGLPSASDLPSLRMLISAGEACSSELVRKWTSSAQAHPGLINAYGPAEATICATAMTCSPGMVMPPAIGTPLENTTVYVLNKRMELCPIGVEGELFIAGIGVARGYEENPCLTSECFVANPFSSKAGARLYKSGDRVQWRADGTLQFLGRSDAQLEIRGIRIEPGEIESALLGENEIVDACVVPTPKASGGVGLTAYVVRSSNTGCMPEGQALSSGLLAAKATFDPSEYGDLDWSGSIRQHLAHRLPPHMLPSQFVALDDIPHLPSGKIDYRALPKPDEVYKGPEDDGPCTQAERLVAKMYASLLGGRPVGRRGNFFDLGGDSLSALRLAGLLSKCTGHDITLLDIYEAPSVQSQAAFLETLDRRQS
ncbi:amino acid adenylation domain-containing protein, partial [Roseibium sp. RKSG952]